DQPGWPLSWAHAETGLVGLCPWPTWAEAKLGLLGWTHALAQEPIKFFGLICFRKRHEIHRIYVQSTARVYEVYYATEWQGRDNEYLCTVRCGASEKEVFLPRCDSGKVMVDSLKDSSPSEEVHVKMTTCESNTSEEDGWVEVKIPDSPLLGDQSNSFPKKPDRNVVGNSQIFYEATAEISDASPCTSLILRLLSVQTKDCIHIEEIYIYADPVESTDSNSPLSMTGSIAGNSLLAMLVPSVLQLSKAGSKVQDRTVSSNPSVQKPELDASMVTKEMDSKIARVKMQETFTSVVEKEQVLAQTMLNERIEKVDSDVPNQHHVLDSVPAKRDITHGHLEKLLDELASRVGRIEASLSRFEDNILKPLSCIETRLQRVEQQLDALSSRSASSKPFQCSRFSAPEFQVDDCDSDVGSDIADVVKEDATVDSPDVVKEDATVNSPGVVEENAAVDDQNVVEDMPDGSAVSSFADGVMFVPASDMCPGLFIKAPDFVNEEDEHVSSNDISESASLSCSKAKASSSIDDALSSALKAFMLSASTNSWKNDVPSVPESQSSNVAVDYPMLDENIGTCETSKISSFNETDGICSTNVDKKSDIMFKEGEGQQMCHQKWHWDSFGGLAMDDASETDENESGSGKGSDNDSNIDEAPNEVPNLMRTCRIWNEDSSSDSNFGENVNESHQNMNLLDENSTDSENEPYTLRNWLSGRQDDYRFQETSFLGTMDCNEMNTEVGDKSVICNQNASKVEIQKALNSCQNDTNTEDSDKSLRCSQNMPKVGILMSLNSSEDAEVLDPSRNEESSLLDVQFVQREKSNYAFQLDGLMMDMFDSETEGSDWLNDIGAREHSHLPLLDTAQVDAPVAVNDDPFIDLEVTAKSSEFRTEGSSNEQLFSSLI
ncbi:hypothetical protein Taro_046522, partial [Colocasia esculenta]|nr:hypothetical protein [Colocasia esculenta]